LVISVDNQLFTKKLVKTDFADVPSKPYQAIKVVCNLLKGYQLVAGSLLSAISYQVTCLLIYSQV